MLCYYTMTASLMEGPGLSLYYPDFCIYFFSETSLFKYIKTDTAVQCVTAWAELAPGLINLSLPASPVRDCWE